MVLGVAPKVAQEGKKRSKKGLYYTLKVKLLVT